MCVVRFKPVQFFLGEEGGIRCRMGSLDGQGCRYGQTDEKTGGDGRRLRSHNHRLLDATRMLQSGQHGVLTIRPSQRKVRHSTCGLGGGAAHTGRAVARSLLVGQD